MTVEWMDGRNKCLLKTGLHTRLPWIYVVQAWRDEFAGKKIKKMGWNESDRRLYGTVQPPLLLDLQQTSLHKHTQKQQQFNMS